MAKRSIKKKKRQKTKADSSKCPRCGKNEAHFIPPCFGDKGIWVCESEGGKPTPQWKEYEERRHNG